MIERDFFDEHITRALALGGHYKPSDEFLMWMYKECECESASDFVRACDEFARSGVKVTLQLMMECINRYKRERLMEDARVRREHERRKFDVIVTVCKFNRCCVQCPVVYCDIVAASAFSNIHRVLNKQLSLVDALGKGMDEFPGIGYEQVLQQQGIAARRGTPAARRGTPK